MKYALQLSKEYEFFDQAYKGEIIGLFEFDENVGLFDRQKAMADQLINHPEKYSLVWELMAETLTKVQRTFPEYKASARRDLEDQYKDFPEDFKINLEQAVQMLDLETDDVFLVPQETLQNILPEVVGTLTDIDLVNFLIGETPYSLFELELTNLDEITTVDLTSQPSSNSASSGHISG